MAENAKETTCTIIPGMRYLDANAAIDWLCEAFGFERGLIVPDGQDGIAHAQLTFGNGMIMLGSAGDDAHDKLIKPPAKTGGIGTQSPYVIVQDADKHYARAVKAGAVVLRELRDEDYGGRGYTCRDPEGHVWSFGTYDPWQDA